MLENNKTNEILQKLAPCIERSDLDACVEEAARVAWEMGIGAGEVFDLSVQEQDKGNYAFTYVLALAATQGLEGNEKANAHYIAGLAARVIEKTKESEQNYKKAIEIFPEFAQAHFQYALLLAELDRKNEAEEHYKKAIEIDPDYTVAHLNYAILLQKQHRRQEAEEHYKKVIDKPDFGLERLNYALLLAELDRKSEAEENYKKVIELYPGLGEVHNNYANLLREKGRFSEAEKEVRIALRIEPANPYYHGTLGDIHADEDCLEDAIKEYQEALKKSDFMNRSATSEVRNNLGRAYALLEQYHRAAKEFEEALKLDDMNVKARRNLRALRKREVLPTISKIQKFLAAILISFLILSICLFLIGRLSDTVFAALIIFMIAFLIFILLYHQIVKFKAGPFEFEKSTEHRLIEVKRPREFERSS
jgi:tetratricopeptide (TPR) repeat protein